MTVRTLHTIPQMGSYDAAVESPQVLRLFAQTAPEWRTGEIAGLEAAFADRVYARSYTYSAETASMFESVSEMVYPTDGGTALKPEMREGWRTYNFEVEDLHTYIAGGMRVHNDSMATIIIAREEFIDTYGHDYDPMSEVDRDLLMTGIQSGDINAYADYNPVIKTDSQGDGFSQVFYDDLVDKIKNSKPALDLTDNIVAQVGNKGVVYAEQFDDGRVRLTIEGNNGNLLEQDLVNRGGGGDRTVFFESGEKERTFYDHEGASNGWINYGENGNVDAVTLGNASAAASEMGELFGSMLGKTLGSGNAIAEIGLGTLLGLTLSNVGTALAAGFSGDLSDFMGNAIRASTTDLLNKNGGVGGDVISRLAGVGASLLTAELADALGIDGFEGQIFTSAVNGVTSQFFKTAAVLAYNGEFSIANLFASANLTPDKLIGGIANGLGGLFGATLGSMIVTPASPEAALFGSVGASIGSIIGAALLTEIPFIGPFFGSMLGQVLGTFIGNLFQDNDDVAYVYIGVNEFGELARTRQYVADHGDVKFARSMSDGVLGTINGFLKEAGLHLDKEKPFELEVGYFNNTRDWLMVKAGDHIEFYDSKNVDPDNTAVARTVQSALSQVIDLMSVVGGDPIMRRAFYASRAQSGNDDSVVALGFDLQVAKDYRFYLEHKGAIHALIEAEPTSAFAAGWIATLTRVNELGLYHGSANDFKGGYYANLKDIAEVQGPHSFGQALAPERLGWIPDLEASDIAAGSMETGNLILRSPDGLSAVTVEDVFGPGRVRTVVGADNTDVDARTLNDTQASVILIKAGNGSRTVFGPSEAGAIIVGTDGFQALIGGNGNDWIRGGNWNEVLIGGNGDDLLVAGRGTTALDGGNGRNTYYLGDENAWVRVSAIDPSGSDTVMAAVAGARGQFNVIEFTATGSQGSGVNSEGSIFSRQGADLIISTIAGHNETYYTDGEYLYDGSGGGYWTTYFAAESGYGNIRVKNFFLSDSGIDEIRFADRTLSNAEVWARAGVNVRIDEAWNNSDRTKAIVHIDGNDSDGNWDSLLVTNTGSGQTMFDVRFLDTGWMQTFASDVLKDHDWAKWDTIYSDVGNIAQETVTFDDGTSIQSGAAITAGDVGDDVLHAAAAGGTAIGDRGDDTLIGSDNVDHLYGNTGNDRLTGGGGADFLYGGKGNDTYVVGDATDTIVEKTDEGSDLIESSVTYSLAGLQIENLTLTGSANINATGNSLANELTGNEGNNTLIGGDGNDTLTGGGGTDILKGGDGNDTYVVTGGETIVEVSGEGTADTVLSTMSYVLAETYVERLTLLGTADIDGTGNSYNNRLTGNDGDNVLDGGAGTDTLIGGLGDDTYVVDSASDVIVEAASEGTDTVQASFSFNLRESQLENLTLLGASAIDGTGNDFDNRLLGNGAVNTLTGDAGNDSLDGGAGADTLVGGTGNDTYVVDDAGDTVTELSSEGTDLVRSSVTFSLGGKQLENLTLLGADTINATGNSFDNILTGNSGANILTGGAGNDILDGGVGADTLKGGTGDDTYTVDNIADTVEELSGEGMDVVNASVSFSVAGQHVETLNLIGSGDLDGTGNGLGNTIVGTSGNNVLDGGAGADTLKGGLGNDTYIVDSTSDVVVENAGEGTDTIESELTVDLGGLQVERIVLRGTANVKAIGNSLDNALYGNDGANTLTGGAGNDWLDGRGGADAMDGGTGDDTYTVNDAGDTVTEASNAGTDTIRSSISFSLSGKQIENLTLLGTAAINATGNSFANVLIGNSGANVIAGGSGNDILDGGEGADTLKGGTGNDTYTVDNAADTVEELSGEGTDVVNASVSFSVAGQHVETLNLIGSGDLNGTGNGLANTLVGTSGNNVLDGGAGNDTLKGGLGDDTYVVDSPSDVVVENAAEGTDTVQASVSFSLRGSQVENLTLLGAAAIDATGNDFDNILLGNEAANTLTADAGNDRLDGGAGADTLVGGIGNDTYVIDNTGDVITENAGEGTDTVETTLSFSLGGLQVERIVLTGTADVNATGNSFDNALYGNDGANTLLGKEGDDWLDGRGGADTMTGGTGNDTYIVNHTGDVVTEASNEGTDLVRSSISYSLSGKQIENLTLLNSVDINATGNSFANILIGNAAANAINGSTGSDTLTGGLGNDTFVFSSTLGSSNVDHITDFSVVDDGIQVAKSVFTALTAETWSEAMFKDLSKGSIDASDRILYDKATGALSYDADGSGTASTAIQFAIIDNKAALTYADIIVV